MAIELDIPTSTLQRAGVAQALAELVAALGGRPGPAEPVLDAPAAAGQPPPAARPRPKKPAPAPKALTWRQFEATLTPATRKFLRLIRERGRLTMPQALHALSMEGSKAIGGLTGALRRKADRYGIELPYRQSHNKLGERMWVSTTRA